MREKNRMNQQMTLWASVITPQRAKQLDAASNDGKLMERLQGACGYRKVAGAQVGNVLGWLRALGETQLHDELKEAIARRNASLHKPVY